jgi:hypothetical protein
MSEMIDRVARAIFASWRKQMDEDGQTGKGPLSFDDLDGDERGFGIDAARAAISAMREPTDAMRDAATKAAERYEAHMSTYHCMSEGYKAAMDEAIK